MHPAPSVILFTVLSGLGFGFLVFLGLGVPAPTGWTAFGLWGIGYGLAAGGLVASTFHLGNPQRAWRAFTQWRSSWLSREAWAAVATLILLAPPALGAWRDLPVPAWIGVAGSAAALGTVLCTAMIYAQLRTVPRWNHWTTPATFAAFALAGGTILAGTGWVASALCLLLGALLVTGYVTGDTRFAERGSTLGTATGLGVIGTPSVFELPHTGDNYLLREMIHVVARKHARKLRVIAVLCAAILPAALSLAGTHPALVALTVAVHLAGAFVARWLFFAEAEHVVGLYYGKR